MITLLLQTSRYAPPDGTVELWTSIDGWATRPLPGTYDAALGAWMFGLDFARYALGFSCKFVVQQNLCQSCDDLKFVPAGATPSSSFPIFDGQTYRFTTKTITFPEPVPTKPVIELGWVPHR